MSPEVAHERFTCKNITYTEMLALLNACPDELSLQRSAAILLSQRAKQTPKEATEHDALIALLTLLSTSQDMSVRWAIAKHPLTPVTILETLSSDSINLVRALVATNASTPISILKKLFNDEKIVRDGLSGNPSTPLKYLLILADDTDAMVRLRILENPACTEALCERLLNDPAPNVQSAAHSKLKRLHHVPSH